MRLRDRAIFISVTAIIGGLVIAGVLALSVFAGREDPVFDPRDRTVGIVPTNVPAPSIILSSPNIEIISVKMHWHTETRVLTDPNDAKPVFLVEIEAKNLTEEERRFEALAIHRASGEKCGNYRDGQPVNNFEPLQTNTLQIQVEADGPCTLLVENALTTIKNAVATKAAEHSLAVDDAEAARARGAAVAVPRRTEFNVSVDTYDAVRATLAAAIRVVVLEVTE